MKFHILLVVCFTSFSFACDSQITEIPAKDVSEKDDQGSPEEDLGGRDKDLGGADAKTQADMNSTPDLGDTASASDLPSTLKYGFLAQGQLGRLTTSCDGKNWDWNQSNDDLLKCYDDANGNYDCDHDKGAGQGLAFNGEYLFATFGWGEPGGVFRSPNGRDWEKVIDATTFGGIAAGKGRVLVGARNSRLSNDNGRTWTDSSDANFEGYNVRSVGYGAGHFVLVMQDDAIEVRVSEDGQSWTRPSIPPACGEGMQFRGGIVGHDNVLVMAGADALICQSDDGGQNWTSNKVAGELTSALVHNGEAFVFWDRNNRYTSVDGKEWTSTSIATQGVNIGQVAFGGGLYVAVNQGWQEWYERQTFWYSTDGLNWTEADRYEKSHPIRNIVYAPLGSCQ